jgi:hypothetical protein
MFAPWLLDLRSLPALVGDPPRPVVGLLCLADGKIVAGDVMGGPDVSDDDLQGCIERALEAADAETLPGFITPSHELAERLRRLFPDCVVQISASGLMDDAFEQLAEHLASAEDRNPFADLPGDLAGRLLDLLQDLLDLRPWDVVPADRPMALRIEDFGLPDARLCIVGHNGDSLGLLLFESDAAYQRFDELSDEEPDPELVPKIVCLTADLVDPPAGGFAGHDGRVPVPDVAVIDGGINRPPTKAEAERLVVVADALVRFVSRRASAIGEAYGGGDRVTGRYRVRGPGATHAVRIIAPARGR